MDKDLLVDPLVGIPDPGSRLIPPGSEGIIDMAGTKRFNEFEFTINGKLVNYTGKKR
jgi:hypothetical protein